MTWKEDRVEARRHLEMEVFSDIPHGHDSPTVGWVSAHSSRVPPTPEHADGKIVPAVQIGYSSAHRQISRVLQILNELYRLIMPKCISKFEMDMIDSHARDNNIFTFGGVNTAGTGVQLNISKCFNGEDLVSAMDIQGSWHLDKDAPPTFTLFALMLRLPKGWCFDV